MAFKSDHWAFAERMLDSGMLNDEPPHTSSWGQTTTTAQLTDRQYPPSAQGTLAGIALVPTQDRSATPRRSPYQRKTSTPRRPQTLDSSAGTQVVQPTPSPFAIPKPAPKPQPQPKPKEQPKPQPKEEPKTGGYCQICQQRKSTHVCLSCKTAACTKCFHTFMGLCQKCYHPKRS